MLFNSFEFLVFLPITLFLFLMLKRLANNELSLAFLVVASLFFYGWWNPYYLFLLVPSIILNYLAGKRLSSPNQKHKKLFLIGAISLNLASIAYFKYSNFFLTNINNITGAHFSVGEILLPLAISFFTFQQIAYLVDSYKGITKEYNFTHYTLFVSFFPQLIAGPIVHHKDMLPQFAITLEHKKTLQNIGIGLSIFAIGLFKKTVLADGIAVYATPVFLQAESAPIDFFTAWGGALAYTFQLYFDFSGYSDMAIGIARMFGIILPLNFFSPYKATNIAEFWRRWHITLSTFLRDYLYIPLGGNRYGSFKRYQNLMITMLLGGLWHGAGWNFVIWGALHGSYLCVHQLWSNQIQPIAKGRCIAVRKIFSWIVTFSCIVFAWVFFRASDFSSALNILSGMVGLNGISLPNAIFARLESQSEVLLMLNITANQQGGTNFVFTWVWVIILLIISTSLPNIKQIFDPIKPALSSDNFSSQNSILNTSSARFKWEPNTKWAVLTAIFFTLGLMTLGQVSEFLYFQF